MLPFLDRFGRTRLSGNDRLSLWPELPKCFAMTVIWLVLRHYHYIRLLNFGQVLNEGRNVVGRVGEPWFRNN